MRAEQVALPGDDPHLRVGPDQIPGLAEIRGHQHAGQQAGQRGGQFRRAAHQVERGLHAVWQLNPGWQRAGAGGQLLTR